MKLNNNTIKEYLLKTLKPYNHCTDSRIEHFLKSTSIVNYGCISISTKSYQPSENAMAQKVEDVLEYAESILDDLIDRVLFRSELESFRSELIKELTDSYNNVVNNRTESAELRFTLNLAACYCFLSCLSKENLHFKTLGKIDEFRDKYEMNN